jgi:hypothetical protein
VALPPPDRLDHLAGVVAAGPDDDRHTAGHRGHGALDERLGLRLVHRRALAGGAERDEAGDAGLDVVWVDHAEYPPPMAAEVEAAA